MASEHELKVDDKYFEKLASHVHGMIADLGDGIGMANSKDAIFGHPELAAKVDAFEKAWHHTAKPNLIDHLQSLHQHIETTKSDIEAFERKLAKGADEKKHGTITEPPPRTPVSAAEAAYPDHANMPHPGKR